MTQLVPSNDDVVAENLEALNDALTLQEILDRLASRKVVAEPEVAQTEPRVIPVSETQQKALSRVTRELRATSLPESRRTLTLDEATELIKLAKDVKVAEKTLAVAVAAIRTAVFNHLDVALEADEQDEDLPVDPKSGHYLVGGELKVEAAGLRFCRELSQGSPDLTSEHLLALYEDGKITRSEYLKATRQVRVLDEDGFMNVLRKRPDILADVEEIIEPGKVTAKFMIREVKKNQDAD